METKEVLITLFMVSILLLAALFVGSIFGQMARGEGVYLSDIELSIIIAGIVLTLELALVGIFRRKKKKEVDIHEMVKEARKITY